MEKLETQNIITNKVISRFSKHQTELVKCGINKNELSLKDKWQALHYKYVELNQMLHFYIALEVDSSMPLQMLYKELKLIEPTIIIELTKFQGYYLYELDTPVSSKIESRQYNYYQSIRDSLIEKIKLEADYTSTVASPLSGLVTVCINDTRYDLSDLK
ncbi:MULTISPECIES: replication initiation protein [Burkholderia]|uniref:replication initiation protein n=1 Tax=Burkholderia TaxID=32008 RepID=UPI000B79DA87|nr:MULTISPECIES: replication initiation protein [Burkholderia]OXJ00351.1 hypothetical protein CFB41_14325 [Burkholderia sp. AU33803]PRD87500.1 hypothetical protein C6P88_28930 [Burkholderia contaminans]